MKKTFIILASLVIASSCSDSSSGKEGDTKTADTTAIAPAPEVKDPAIANGLELITKSDCFTCHKLSEASVGPAYALVAAKYKDTPNAIDTLAGKIIKGGSGNWGSIPMTPHPQLPLEDAKTMAHYVMSIK